jgi:hypothetical protein
MKCFLSTAGVSSRIPIHQQQEARMDLSDAPIPQEGFFTVSDQDKSKDFYVRILGGNRSSQWSFLKHRRI